MWDLRLCSPDKETSGPLATLPAMCFANVYDMVLLLTRILPFADSEYLKNGIELAFSWGALWKKTQRLNPLNRCKKLEGKLLVTG